MVTIGCCVVIKLPVEHLVCASRNKCSYHVRDLDLTRVIQVLSRHSDRVKAVAANPDDEVLVGGAAENYLTAKLWLASNFANGTLSHRTEEPEAVCGDYEFDDFGDYSNYDGDADFDDFDGDDNFES
jgi:WD40 repeat protein